MRYFSAFAGIGGFDLGIGDSGECVGYSEIDKYALQIYTRHFPQNKNYGDMEKIFGTGIPHCDLFVGGFPCQPFSSAGHRRGLSDPRANALRAMLSLLAIKRPRHIIIENVSSMRGGDAELIKLEITRSLGGVKIYQTVIDSALVSAQRRRRIYWTCLLYTSPSPRD